MSLQSFFIEKKAEIIEVTRKLAICFFVISVLLFIISRVFMIWEDIEWCLMVAAITNYVSDVSVTILLLLVLLYLVMLVRDKQVKEVVSPLQHLTPEEEKQIEKLIHDLPHHKDREDEINMKEVARYLTALAELGYISIPKSADKNGLRQWVAQVTGKETREQYRFNDAYPSTNRKEIEKAKKIIEDTLKSF